MPASLRILFCSLSTAAVLALGVAPATSHAGTCAGAESVPTTASTVDTARAATLCLLNEQRAAAGLEELRAEPTLERAATGYSIAMISQRVFAHVLPGGDPLHERLSDYLAPAEAWTIGENLGWGEREYGSPASIVDAWMKSEGHRRNVLDPKFREIGIGVVPGSPLSGPSAVAVTYTTDFGSREGVPTADPTVKRTVQVLSRSLCTRTAIRRVSKQRRPTRVAACARAARVRAAYARARS
jgi:uncharacterized protein YkwD